MSLTVRQLNADSTFLLTFTPPFAPPKHKYRFPGTFTILLDPWLNGASIVGHPKFATNKHSKPAAISSLAELDEDVDLIIISQDKSDHLHKESLCSLSRDSRVPIVATPKAAKEIRRWQHFKNDVLHVLEPFDAKKPDTVMRIPVEPYSSASAEGEVTINDVVQKRDITGLHNAIGITYCPPGTLLTSPDGSTVKLSDMPMMSPSRPGTAADSPNSPSSPKSPMKQRYIRSSLDGVDFIRPSTRRPPSGDDDYDATKPPVSRGRTGSPQGRPSTSGSRPPMSRTVSKRQDNFEHVLSVIYTPHGVPPATLRPYVYNHLAPLRGALPVTALIHSLNMESNPWFMGGLISGGAPGGIKLLEEVDVKYWISAHDEIKDSSGLAVAWISKTRYTTEDTTKMLRQREGMGSGKAVGTQVVALECGERRRFAG
ncbi:hypothetical protein M409DRAFT_66711 [Zasmidium cellare ATCC 36951]|uniref:Uncharacterized protein n=1 Tax=Zasmidium cellare ATCC 36951 TaxID=1080233 RepID=A0A6A6CJU9_ZASCE|nr:uncharacterized protein M409DRAFT_66711 [Zasmidium cellare ATCC 36951]KAF2166222.1 hypothetical protein M409DRAFT_66711 [Zasmidium cellare ATCC 36951]